MKKRFILTLLFLASSTPLAQQSTSYKLEEHVLNAGGTPEGGVPLSSLDFQVGLSSLGDGLLAGSLTSASFTLQGSFVSSHPAAGEVTNLIFTDETTLQWDPEPSVGAYNIYRDLISNMGGLGYGNCEQPGLPANTAQDSDAVPLGDAFFYLVTAENTLQQEGPKGLAGDGTPRLGAFCP